MEPFALLSGSRELGGGSIRVLAEPACTFIPDEPKRKEGKDRMDGVGGMD